jgi:hypothetical protein
MEQGSVKKSYIGLKIIRGKAVEIILRSIQKEV